ncbi:hypothetical protein [Streptomyces noursei]|uniref:hypothetical protein n=1 Tax=Streptomyces noursei TaxID=1971 RepID=UPI00167A1245|nr:hypothetical protein [Streptomyces noursei]MCZ1019845.1 hypothetical protein [Streptomyces noursei]GGX36281.1 hypothetical protein GCM10010341_67150 [Streptomyces noursei]
MPIYLPEPDPTRPADGKGYNRLTLNAHMGVGGAQCALLPQSYPTLLESRDTRRARWGGFGWCIRERGECRDCRIFASTLDGPERQVPFNASRVLVRIETAFLDEAAFNARPVTALWMTDRPTDADYRTHGQKWGWSDLQRLKGWELGRQHRDEIGEGFWVHRTPYAPAPHVTVRTRRFRTFARHAFVVKGTRAALLTCHGDCRHDDGTLLNVIGHHTPQEVDDENVKVRGWQLSGLPTGSKNGRRLALAARTGSVSVTLIEGTQRLARLTFDGSQWSVDQIHGAATALLDHTER